jgi:hypothetical protein
MTPNNPEDGSEDERTNGAAQPPPVEEIRPREQAPPAVAELAASCMRFVFARYKVPLDFTPDTLGVLDHYVKEAQRDLEVRPEGQALVEATVGAYFGEVVRGVFPSSWRTDGTYIEWRLSMSEVYLAFNPIGMAREALMLADAPGWHAHLAMHAAEEEHVERRLASLPGVTDEEYYALTTRFDVIELAVEALRASSRQP